MKKGEKNGQFFLVTAIIFIGLLFMALSILNYSKEQTNTGIREIAQEMQIESSKILEYSSYTEDNKIENFTKKYSAYAGEELDIYYIIGNQTAQEVYNYTNGEKEEMLFTFDGLNLNTTIGEINHTFKFNKGENFYFVIVQEINGEKYLVKG